MKPFMGNDFLLSTQTAKDLYHKYVKNMPILDYHCHLDAKEIYEDCKFKNITEVWLGGDHYKWRQMRSNGVEEKFITGQAEDREKFQKWAETVEKAIGNPLYHWSHLELKNYFGYEGYLNGTTAQEVWELCNKKLQDSYMGARGLIEKSNVKVICTTDDPIDSLEWHKKIAEDASILTAVYPTWRPDKAMNIEKEDFISYLKQLERITQIGVGNFQGLLEALQKRMTVFQDCGCRISDHGLDYVMYEPFTWEEIEAIYQKRCLGQTLAYKEIRQYKTAFMVKMGREYAKRGWSMQLHYGVLRDADERRYLTLGADTGFDYIQNYAPASELVGYLNALSKTEQLPKTILYSLNPQDNAVIGTIIGCFQNSTAIGKIQHGSAWWFNDHKTGMIAQLTSLANLGLLGNFIGMLTDSRSFLSYTRHEYFRRILCELLGTWVENGEYPPDWKSLKEIVEGISYKNAKRYFEF